MNKEVGAGGRFDIFLDSVANLSNYSAAGVKFNQNNLASLALQNFMCSPNNLYSLKTSIHSD